MVAGIADDEPLRPDVRRGAKVLVVGYLALAVIMLGLGLTLIHALQSTVGRWDESAVNWLADRRTAGWNRVTGDATFLVNTLPAIGIALVITVVLSILHRWRMALLVVVALALELVVFLSVTWIVARPRPDVHRLNSAPSTGSFPSGHTAAATVLFVGLALGLSTRIRSTVVRVILFIVAGMAVALVAFGRVYRGLHNPSDVIVGAVLGIACLTVAALVVRAAYEPREESLKTTDETRDSLARIPSGPVSDDSSDQARSRSSAPDRRQTARRESQPDLRRAQPG